MAWQKGPLPPDTWGWGGVTVEPNAIGFYFADFHGDHVEIGWIGDAVKTLKPEEVILYDNSLTLPPGAKGRAK